ncbi:hypothetical protein [Cyanobium sp. Morenito 9A2]|uniref:hypothetical protein n=1 Tax=Cyanobium sp. Morenito 9A2 TaxID=2823718 RepID=UPI0020CDCE90|nr:hypothetical protein [Cyanobium sp. Morenito 9A2]MCP9848884.1 hypothetical protein [Cyanobium sp. Morenito 9A2]
MPSIRLAIPTAARALLGSALVSGTLLLPATLMLAIVPPAALAQAVIAPKGRTPTLEGTTWSGTDSDGDFYSYTFLPGGALRFTAGTGAKAKTYQDEGDNWAQNGPVVIIVTTKYATRQGLIRGNRMAGDAWNVKNHRWTWEAKRTSPPTAGLSK